MHRIQVTWNNTYFPFTNVSFRRSARRIAGWPLGPSQSTELDFYFTCNGNEHNVFQCGRSVEDDKGNCILKNFGVFCSHCENNHLFSFRLVFIELECFLFTSIKTFFRNRALFQPLLIKLQTRYCNFTFEKQLVISEYSLGNITNQYKLYTAIYFFTSSCGYHQRIIFTSMSWWSGEQSDESFNVRTY